MDFCALALIAVAVASASLGLVVYTRAPSRSANRMWCLHALLVSLWALVILRVLSASDVAGAVIYLRIAHLVSALVLATFVDFCSVFPEGAQGRNLLARRTLYLSALVVGGIASLPAVVRSVELTPTGPSAEFGWPLLLLGAYSMVLLISADVTLWRKSRRLDGVARVQTVYVLAGAVGFQAMVLFINVVLPMATGNSDYSRWGVVTYFFTILTVTVAMAKHSLWDLATVARRAQAGALALGTAAGVGAALVYGILTWDPAFIDRPLEAAILWIVIGGALGATLGRLYRSFTDLFVSSAEEQRRSIGKLLRDLGEAIVQPPLSGSALLPMLEATAEFFAPRFVTAYLRTPGGQFVRAGTVDPHSYLKNRREDSDDELLPESLVAALDVHSMTTPLYAGNLLRFGTTRDVEVRLAAMVRIHAHVIVPLTWLNDIVGLIILGPKISRDLYSSHEMDLLKDVGSHAAIAVKNHELRTEIVAEKERTEKVITELESGVVAVGADGAIAVVNPAACQMLGMAGEELLGQSIDVLPEVLRDNLQLGLRDGTTVSRHGAYISGESGLRVAFSTFVLQGPGGKNDGAGVVFRDLRTEDALRKAEDEAERLRFVRAVSAGMAHEIRNPLVAIRTFAELAPMRLDDVEFRESFIEVTRSEVDRLEDLVTQFMTLAKPPRSVCDPIDLTELLGMATAAVSANAESRQVRVTTRIPPDLPTLHGDDGRLYQAIANLLLNALEAAPPGGDVEVRLSTEAPRNHDTPAMNITVWNSGSYIAPENRARLFEPFFTTKPTGTGLGLAICHTIAEEHGGTLLVDSDEEAGTSFTLQLPLTPSYDTQAVNAL